MDITQLILDDHHEQRRLFAILEQVDPRDTQTLTAVWDRLAAFLELHAAAEEAIFYPALLQVGLSTGRKDAEESETIDAIHDHNEIRDTIAAVPPEDVGSDGWYAAIAAVNKANGDHMAEEEREGLTDFRRYTGLQLRHDLAVTFAAFEATHYTGVTPVDKDPAEYVREAEQGSLPLDSLGGQSGSRPPGPAARPGGSAARPGGSDGSLSIGSLKEG